MKLYKFWYLNTFKTNVNFFERVVVGNHWFTAIKNSRSDLIFVTLSWYLQSANNLFVFYLKDKKPHCLLLVTFKCICLIFVEQLFYLIWKIISKVQGFWVRVSFCTQQDKTRLEDTFRIAKTMTRLLMSSPVARENSRIIPHTKKSKKYQNYRASNMHFLMLQILYTVS